MAKPNTRSGFVSSGPKMVAPQAMVPSLLQEAHNSTIAGHGGSFRTIERLRQICWWPNMERDVHAHIKACAICGASPHSRKATPSPVQPLPIPSGPNNRIHVDLYGPLKPSASNNRYVMVYTDAFTRMTRLVAIADKSAPTVATAILNIIYVSGVPKQIHTDQGNEFNNCLLYTSPSPRDKRQSRMPSSA